MNAAPKPVPNKGIGSTASFKERFPFAGLHRRHFSVMINRCCYRISFLPPRFLMLERPPPGAA